MSLFNLLSQTDLSFSIEGGSPHMTKLSLFAAEKQFGILISNTINKSLQEEKNANDVAMLKDVATGAFFLVPPHLDGGAIHITVQGKETVLFFVYVGKKSCLKICVDAVSLEGAHVLVYVVADDEALVSYSAAHRTPGAGVYSLRAEVKKEAKFTTSFLVLQGAQVYENSVVKLTALGAACEQVSLFLAGENEGIESEKTVFHKAPKTTSNILSKAVLGKNGKVKIRSRTKIEKSGKESKAEQHLMACLLDKNAHFFAKPELDILCSEVEASHGATSGTVDEEALLYANARGIAVEDAKRMLVEAFVEELMGQFEVYREEVFKKIACL